MAIFSEYPAVVKVLLATVCLTIINIEIVNAISSNYWSQRDQILQKEELMSIGGNTHLNAEESTVNDILMKAKHKEFDKGIEEPATFLPSQNFMAIRDKIEKSEVFKIIRQLPKGAVLHAHSSAFVSDDFVFSNITFRDNLYVCDEHGTLRLKFASKVDKDCSWKLLSKLRKDKSLAEDLNRRIYESMSLVTKNPDEAYPTGDAAWEKFNSIFKFINPLHTYRPAFEDFLYQGLQEHYDDNVMYIELRTSFTLLYDLDGTRYNRLETAEVYYNVIQRFMKDHPDFIGVKLIYAPHRVLSDEALKEALELAKTLEDKYPSFVVGFDLVGQEDKGKALTAFANALKANRPKETYFFHAGETDWYGTSVDNNLIDAILLGTKRIGHGYALAKHPIVLDLIRQKNIAVEVSPISNQVLGLVKDLRNHPCSVYFSQDLPIVIANDDPGLWGAKGLSYDFYMAFMGMMSRNADLRALKQLATNSILYSSMNRGEQQRALNVWTQKWNQFLQNIAGKNFMKPSRRINGKVPFLRNDYSGAKFWKNVFSQFLS